MPKLTVVIGPLIAATLLAAACSGDDEALYTPPPAAPKVREFILSDPYVQALLGDGQQGTDYWLSVNIYPKSRHDGEVASFFLLFGEALTYEGEALTATAPCTGDDYGNDEVLEDDHPCLEEPREYSTATRSYVGQRAVQGRVNLGLGHVFNVLTVIFSDESFKILIEQIESEEQ